MLKSTFLGSEFHTFTIRSLKMLLLPEMHRVFLHNLEQKVAYLAPKISHSLHEQARYLDSHHGKWVIDGDGRVRCDDRTYFYPTHATQRPLLSLRLGRCVNCVRLRSLRSLRLLRALRALRWMYTALK